MLHSIVLDRLRLDLREPKKPHREAVDMGVAGRDQILLDLLLQKDSRGIETLQEIDRSLQSQITVHMLVGVTRALDRMESSEARLLSEGPLPPLDTIE